MNLWVHIYLFISKTYIIKALHAAELPESEGFKFSWRQLQLWADVFRNLFTVRSHIANIANVLSV